MPTLTPRAAQNIHDRITAAGGWCWWLVAARHGKYVAWALVADRAGGRQEGGELVADTLEELRAMLPRGLARRAPSAALGRDVVETWD